MDRDAAESAQPQDQAFYVFSAVASVGYLYLRRNSQIEGTDLSFATTASPHFAPSGA